MNKVFDFDEQKKIGDKGEVIQDKFFSTQMNIGITPATEHEQKTLHFDRTFTKNNQQIRFEYKTDHKAKQTGNLFIEVISNDRYNTPGWVHTCQADGISFLVGKHLYVLRMKDLREHINKFGKRYILGYGKNETYTSKGRCVPISIIKQFKHFKEYDIRDQS